MSIYLGDFTKERKLFESGVLWRGSSEFENSEEKIKK